MYASWPDWRISHMLIALTANSLQHWPSPSKRRPVCHRSATVRQVCCTGLTTVERVIDFWIFDLGGLPLGQRSPKGEKTCYPPRSTILQKFSPIVQTVYEIYITKVFSTFWPKGLTPVPKFTKRGDDLVDSDMYHSAKFHRPTSTRVRDIHYHVTKVLQTKKKNKKTVTEPIYPQHAYRHVGITNWN